DGAGFLEGPTFDAMIDKLKSDFDNSDTLPPGPTADFADALVNQAYEGNATDEQKATEGPTKLREFFDQWMNKALENAPDPSFDALPRAVIVPSIDYGRGWLNYAHAYGRMRVVDRPDRVVILGLNQHGRGTGVVGCDKGYETPLGTSPLAKDLDTAIREQLGSEDADRLYRDKYDHERESSIELQVPWIQHVFGQADGSDKASYPPVYGALLYNPLMNEGKPRNDDDLTMERFIEVLKSAISSLPGKTLIVAATELSHVGKAFGDQQSFAEDNDQSKAFREKLINHDREHIKMIKEGRYEEVLPSLTWAGNWSRWSGLGTILAACQLTDASEVELLNYAASADNQGMAMVSMVAMAVK
ncbi:MAG: AmmeMemoRadiSam system protein B, partial [Planctomycetota bacterium]